MSLRLGLSLLFCCCSPPVLFVARVYDAEAGKPLPGALVMVENTEMMAAADSAGRTPATRAAPHTLLRVTGKGYLPAVFAVPGPGKSSDPVRLDAGIYPDLPRTVAGRVIDPGSKAGCYPAFVSLAGPSSVLPVVSPPPGDSLHPRPSAFIGGSSPDSGSVVRAGTDGSYVIPDFPAGPRTLTASCSGYVALTLEVLARGADTTRLDFFLRDTTNEGALDGLVMDAATGTPVPDAAVSVEETGLAAKSDSTGRYSFARIPVGEHRITCRAGGYEEKTVPFRVVKGWSVTVDFELTPAPR